MVEKVKIGAIDQKYTINRKPTHRGFAFTNSWGVLAIDRGNLFLAG
jgi:hypothetical protein